MLRLVLYILIFNKMNIVRQIGVLRRDCGVNKRVGDGVLDVPKHPKNCVGADIIRPLKNHIGYCFVILSE